MNRFGQPQSHKPVGFFLSLILFCLVLSGFILGTSSFSRDTTERQKEALENALTHDITYCYAVEGSYPESLDYLKDHYGLTYDEDSFYVDYQASGANIFPNVTVIEKEE